jgi:hypothetical protein
LKAALPTISTRKMDADARGNLGSHEFTIYVVIGDLWQAIKPLVIREINRSCTRVSDDGRTFFVSARKGCGSVSEEVPITVAQLSETAIYTKAAFYSKVEALLPGERKLCDLFDVFAGARENFGNGDQFLFEENKSSWSSGQHRVYELVNQLLEEFKERGDRHGLWADDHVNPQALLRYNAAHVEALKALQMELCMNTGVCARCSSLAHYTIRGADRSTRIHGTSVAIGWGKSKAGHRRSSPQSDIRGLEEKSGLALLVLLSVPRYAMILAAEAMQKQNPADPLARNIEAVRKYIFAGLQDGVWTSARLNKELGLFTAQHLQKPLRDLHIRNFATGLLNEIIPTRLQHSDSSTLVEMQGDHTGRISRRHYAQKGGHSSDIAYGNPSSLIRISNIYRAAVGTGPVDPSWRQEILSHPMLRGPFHLGRAEMRAGDLVKGVMFQTIKAKRLTTPAAIKAEVADVLRHMDFIMTVSIPYLSFVTSTKPPPFFTA